MITVVCISPSLDRTIELPALTVGGTNRAQRIQTVAGGKGVNVAMAVRQMGEAVRLIVCRHEKGAQALFEALEQADVSVQAVDVPGELRVNLKLMDMQSGVTTEINASAQEIPKDALAALEEAAVCAARQSSWLVLTGSIPKGNDPAVYARILARVKREAPACKTALDVEGEAFSLGVMEKPDLVKPNRHELELHAGKPLITLEDVQSTAKTLVDAGVGTVLVSMDKDGCMLVEGEETLLAQAICVPVVTTVGAGDAMLSGYICAGNGDRRAALCRAVASATARVAWQDGQWAAYAERVQLQSVKARG